MSRQFTGISSLPKGEASDNITEGCLVLEGGAFRSLYTQGVLDALMENDFNFQTVIGVSAGGMCGAGYVAGQIGWCARINLEFRHDSNYIGLGAMRSDHGITGFSYLFGELMKDFPFDRQRFDNPARRFAVCATDVLTGRPAYFERGRCADIFKAIQASATVPYVSKPVEINGRPYLDGGATGSTNIPYDWAVRQEFRRIIVVKTRDRAYRADPAKIRTAPANRLLYRQYPEFEKGLQLEAMNYNSLLERVDADAMAGRCFVIAPSVPLEVGRFEPDVDKLAQIYYRGYNDMYSEVGRLRKYLEETSG